MPPSRQQLEAALVAADKAGNAEDAKALAQALRDMGDQPSKPEADFSASRMVGNIPSSAGQYLSDITYPIRHPVNTAKSLAGLAAGGVDKLAQTLSESVPEGAKNSINAFNNKLVDAGVPLDRIPESGEVPAPAASNIDPLISMFKNRYGTLDAAKKTLETDPVGAVADLSGVLTLGATMTPRVAGVGGKLEQLAANLEPLNMAKTGVKAVSRGVSNALPRSLPGNMYESSAKFSTTFPKHKRQRLSKTALEHGVLPTPRGVDKLQGLMSDLNAKIDGLIQDATNKGVEIPREEIYRHLSEAKAKVGGPRIDAADNLKQIDNVASKFDDYMWAIGKDTLTPTELQTFKRSAYDSINFDAKNLRSNVGTDAARKAMARAAKESIEGVAPVKELNKEYGELIELLDPLQRSSGRIENRNLVSIDAPVKIAAGAGAGGHTGAAAGTLAALLEHPKIKARLALGIHNAQQAGLSGLTVQDLANTLIQQGMFQAGRATSDQQF